MPPGIWDISEYERLPFYDADTPFQPVAVFLCHQTTPDDPRVRMCAGWVATHDMDHNLALRMAVSAGQISPQTYEQVCDYTTDVPVFASGREAADHGKSGIDCLGDAATVDMEKIARRRPDVRTGRRGRS